MDDEYVQKVTQEVNQNLEGYIWASQFGDAMTKAWTKTFLQIAGVKVEGINNGR